MTIPNFPGFTAEMSVYTSKNYRQSIHRSIATGSIVIPQDCGFFKKLGCGLGPISWCALASLGGSRAFYDCVDRLSGGNCVDCIEGGLDPRNNRTDPNPPPEVDPLLNPLMSGLTIIAVVKDSTSNPTLTTFSSKKPSETEKKVCICGINMKTLSPILKKFSRHTVT